MSVEQGRRAYERKHKPAKVKTLDDLRDATPGTAEFGELSYLASRGNNWEAAALVRQALLEPERPVGQPSPGQANLHNIEGGSVPELPPNVGPDAA